jgi:hypothetical protein
MALLQVDEAMAMKHLRLALPLGLLACSGGVGKDAPTDSAEPTADHCAEAAKHTPGLIAGTGEATFEAIEDGSVLNPVFGPQGGHHIWTALQATGLNPGQGKMINPDTASDGGGSLVAQGQDPVDITIEISFDDGNIGPYRVAFSYFLEGNTEASELAGLTAIIDAWGIVAHYEERNTVDATLWLSVIDGCGTVVIDSKPFLMGLEDIEGIYD